jgi:hypothetical protein
VNSEPKSTSISNWDKKLNPKPWTSCNTFTFYFAANATVSSLILRKQTIFIRIQKNMTFKSLYEIMHSSTKLASLKEKESTTICQFCSEKVSWWWVGRIHNFTNAEEWHKSITFHRISYIPKSKVAKMNVELLENPTV